MQAQLDYEYWVGHCDGFQVRIGRKRLGFIEEVCDGGKTLAVRGGFLGRRRALVPSAQIFAVVPRAMKIWLSTAPPAVVPRLLGNEVTAATRRHAEKIAA